MTQPDDTRIRLLTAMGWKNSNSTYGYNKAGFCVLLPELDANLLAAAREQLLTTEELWHSYLFSIELELPSFKDGRYSFCKTAFLAPITTHCEALLSALERNKITQDQARAILAVKEAHV